MLTCQRYTDCNETTNCMLFKIQQKHKNKYLPKKTRSSALKPIKPILRSPSQMLFLLWMYRELKTKTKTWIRKVYSAFKNKVNQTLAVTSDTVLADE